MEIVGLTDADTLRNRAPICGYLHKGGPKTPKRPGEDLEYFRFTSDDEEIEKDFVAAFSAEPKSLRVFLPFPHRVQNFPTWKEARSEEGGNRILEHRCDGLMTSLIRNTEGKGQGVYSTVPVPCPGGCRPVGRLLVMIPELIAKGHMGLVALRTTSLNDLPGISASLLYAEDFLAGLNMTLKGVPFTLYRKSTTVTVPIKDKRVKQERSLVYIDIDKEWLADRFGSSTVEQYLARLAEPVVLEGSAFVPQLESPDEEEVAPAVDAVAEENPESEAPPKKLFSTPVTTKQLQEYVYGTYANAFILTDDEAKARGMKFVSEFGGSEGDPDKYDRVMQAVMCSVEFGADLPRSAETVRDSLVEFASEAAERPVNVLIEGSELWDDLVAAAVMLEPKEIVAVLNRVFSVENSGPKAYQAFASAVWAAVSWWMEPIPGLPNPAFEKELLFIHNEKPS